MSLDPWYMKHSVSESDLSININIIETRAVLSWENIAVDPLSAIIKLSCVLFHAELRPWASAGFFPGVRNVRVWRTEAPAGSRGRTPVGVGGREAPRSWQHFLKIVHKYFVYWDFRQYLQQKEHFTTFSWVGGSAPLPIPAGAHGWDLVRAAGGWAQWFVFDVYCFMLFYCRCLYPLHS